MSQGRETSPRTQPGWHRVRTAYGVALGGVLAIGLAARLMNVAIKVRLPVTSYQLTWTSGDMAGPTRG